MTSACGSAAPRSSRLERARFGASSIVTRSRSKKTLHAAEQDRPDVAAARAALKAEQPSLKAPRLVFIDETAVTTKMVRHYGRSPRGERLVASVPHGHWKTLTFIAALRFDGMTAPYVIDGAMDGPTFIAYVEQVLTPTLKKGDVVFMDNLRTHKVDGVRQAIEAVGASVRYLPAYSPDLNPIEQAFSKLKTATRKGAARIVKALWKLIGRLIKTFVPEHCVNYMPAMDADPHQVEFALVCGRRRMLTVQIRRDSIRRWYGLRLTAFPPCRAVCAFIAR